jgi:hypothetical protein
MSRFVFILGAGASAEAGAPLMANFLERAETLLPKQEFAPLFEEIAALGTLHSKSNLDIDNIEFVFATFEMAALIGKMPYGRRTDPNHVIAQLKRLIVLTLERSVQFPRDASGGRPTTAYNSFVEFLTGLPGARSGTCPASIFSFNYDLAVDFALRHHSLEPDYCLDGNRQSHQIPLLKLHGSINWAKCADESVAAWPVAEYLARRFMVDLPGTTATTFSLTMGSEQGTYNGWPAPPTEPFIVPPTWTKSTRHRELSHVWRRAAIELEDAEFIVVIGYSCPESDAFFRYLYALGTSSLHRLKRFVVIDPSQDVADRFRNMLGQDVARRFIHHPFIFSGAMPAIKSDLGL